jgi:hypothetical protein
VLHLHRLLRDEILGHQPDRHCNRHSCFLVSSLFWFSFFFSTCDDSPDCDADNGSCGQAVGGGVGGAARHGHGDDERGRAVEGLRLAVRAALLIRDRVASNRNRHSDVERSKATDELAVVGHNHGDRSAAHRNSIGKVNNKRGGRVKIQSTASTKESKQIKSDSVVFSFSLHHGRALLQRHGPVHNAVERRAKRELSDRVLQRPKYVY